MTYSQPYRAACSPTPRHLDIYCVYEKYSRFIHLFIFYMIFKTSRTFRALWHLILYIIYSSFYKRNYLRV